MLRERELTVLSRLSGELAESLETESLMRSAIDMVAEVLKVEMVLIYRLDAEGYLRIAAWNGVSDSFVQNVDKMMMGEGFNGRVAETGEPMIIDDSSRDPRLTRESVRKERLQTQLIVPMKCRGLVVGTLCVGMRRQRVFDSGEIELLVAMASQIGAALENQRLREEQSLVAERLRQSEEHYRQLYESAHDAIFIHDENGDILSANRAAEEVSGYSHEELLRTNVKELLSVSGLETARAIRRRLSNGEDVREPYEQCLIRKDGTEASLSLTTNVLPQDGQGRLYQNIARDTTDEKRMQQNLRSYVQQITVAQEKERLRIARELHDSTAQNLIALLHRLQMFYEDQPQLPIDTAKELWDVHEKIKDTLQEVRNLSRDLRPSILDDAGLLPALRWLLRQLEEEHRIETKLSVQGTERRFLPEVELTLFRIVQEGLRNIGRHSGATKAEVTIIFEDAWTTAIIRDNGTGFHVTGKITDLVRSGRLGLVGMEERVKLLDGSLEVTSEPGEGTTLTVKVRT